MPNSGATVAQIDEPVIIMSIDPTLTCWTTSASLPSWLFGKNSSVTLGPTAPFTLAAKRWYQM